MSITSTIIMSGPSNGDDSRIHIKQETIIGPGALTAEKVIEKKKERKVEETIIDGFAISAFESWEDLQDEINEVIASNLIKKQAAEQEAASNRRVGELVKKKKSKNSSSSKKSHPNTGDNSNSLLQPRPKADKVKQETKNDSSQSSKESSTGQSSKTTSTPSKPNKPNKPNNKRPKPENLAREDPNEGTSHDQSERRENNERSTPHNQHKRLKDESQRASKDTNKHVPTRPVDNQSHSPHLNQLYNITSNIQHIHSMQTSPMKQQPTHHHPSTPPHPNRINPQPPPPPQSAPNHHYSQAPPPPPPPQPQTQPHFNPLPQTAPHNHYAQPPPAPPNHHQYPSYMAPPMTHSPYGFYPHHRPQFSSTMSTSSVTQPADLYGGGIITEQTISRQISMIPPQNPQPFVPPPGFGQYRMPYPPINAPYNHSIPAIQSHGHPSHPFPTYPETSPQATQRLLDLGAAYSAFMTSGRAPPGSFSGYPSNQSTLMAPPQASTANVYPPEMSASKAFEYQRAISRYSGFNPHAANYPPRPQAFPSAWWPPSY